LCQTGYFLEYQRKTYAMLDYYVFY